MKADLTRFNNRVKWSYYVYINKYRKGEGKRVHCSLQRSITKKLFLYLLRSLMAHCKCYSLSLVRSVEDGLEPSQTYDEVNKTSSSILY